MRWLQWSTIDLEKGLGGVEVHARSLARELSKLGVKPKFSSDPKELMNSDWDVIQTHGSGFPAQFIRKSKSIRIQTLHGSTLGRMFACREFFWLGGYHAELREIFGILNSDIVLSVRPNVSLFRLARKVGKINAVSWNGWDAESPEQDEINFAEIEKIKPFFLYIGRGIDPPKGADFLNAALPELHSINSNFKLVAVPGEGFENNTDVFKTGRVSSKGVSQILKLSKALIAPSRYEGNALVLLEALAHGVPVVSTRVGAVDFLSPEIQGLFIIDDPTPEAIVAAIKKIESLPTDSTSRQMRATK
ncbi:MAG: glycosyltransferase family 4 protein, partial [Bdellovibrionota bacterium]